ncbi:MAG: hypothetical protein ACRDHZ_01515 [Ktedonobacteraceae bacterium]
MSYSLLPEQWPDNCDIAVVDMVRRYVPEAIAALVAEMRNNGKFRIRAAETLLKFAGSVSGLPTDPRLWTSAQFNMVLEVMNRAEFWDDSNIQPRQPKLDRVRLDS